MDCSHTRELLHQWLDLAGIMAMPPEAAAHIRECSDCRGFIRRWDQIELGLQALRDQVPAPSLEFKIARESHAAKPRPTNSRNSHVVYGRLAAAGAAAIVILFGISYALAGLGPFGVRQSGALAIVRPAPGAGYRPDAATLKNDFPLAQTR